jgi:RNase P protein component
MAQENSIFELDEGPHEPVKPPPAPVRRVGNGLVAIALALPIVGSIPLFFVTDFGLALGISGAVVLVTSILVAIDAHRVENAGLAVRSNDSAIILFLGMCLLWIAIFPYAFFRRRKFVRPDLFLPATLVAMFFGGAPMLYAVLVKPGLPSCTSQQVVELLEQLIRKSAVGGTVSSIDGHREISYDRVQDRRTGQCVAHIGGKDIVVNYTVEWLDRQNNQFAVKIPPPDLPSCTSQEVVQALERAIRQTPEVAKALAVVGHREVSYDRAKDRRKGQCVAHTDTRDINVDYVVEWLDRDQGKFVVRVVPPLPACTSQEVAQVLEKLIRGTPEGANAKSIDGHREISYDPAQDIRIGECVVRTEQGRIIVKFNVKWGDREKNRFEVRIIDSVLERSVPGARVREA